MPIRPGGVFIAGQDQDKLRGEYNPSESETKLQGENGKYFHFTLLFRTVLEWVSHSDEPLGFLNREVGHREHCRVQI